MLSGRRAQGNARATPSSAPGAGKKSSKSTRTGPPIKEKTSWFGWGKGAHEGSDKSKKQSRQSAARQMELQRKAAARENLRRKAERRLYKPASFVLLGKLSLMWLGLILLIYGCVFLTALACFLNPYAVVLSVTMDYLWSCAMCLSLIGIPSVTAHLFGYVFLPPVWPEVFPEREKVLEELGGVLYIRFYHVKGVHRPQSTKKAVETAVEVLSRTLPNTLWEIEVVTDRDLFLENASVKEFSFPDGGVGQEKGWTFGSVRKGKSWFGGKSVDKSVDSGGSSTTHHHVSETNPCELLAYASEVSKAGWGDWVVHMGPDGILNQRAVDSVLVHCARESRLSALASTSKPRARRLAQGSVMPGITRTANALDGGVPTMGAWVPAMAEVLRAGESAGATHLAYSRGTVGPALATSPGRFLVVPNEMERTVGWVNDGTPPGTEHTAFTLRCLNRGARFSWLDAGVHVPVTQGSFALFKNRARENASLNQLLVEDSSDPVTRISPATQTLLATMCVSSGFAKLAPVCVAIAPFVHHAGTSDAFVLACLVGTVAAAQMFVYAVGFYVSSGARHLARGAPGYVLYFFLFLLTLLLTPLFSAFELFAILFAPFFTAKRTGTELRDSRSKGSKKDSNSSSADRSPDRSDRSSSDDMIASDGEVRRWKTRGGSRNRRSDKSGSQTFSGANVSETVENGIPDAAVATLFAHTEAAKEANRQPPSRNAARDTPKSKTASRAPSFSGSFQRSARADRWLKSGAPVAKRSDR